MYKKWCWFCGGFMIGSIVGIVGSILLTPLSGKEIRDRIKKKGEEIKEKIISKKKEEEEIK